MKRNTFWPNQYLVNDEESGQTHGDVFLFNETLQDATNSNNQAKGSEICSELQRLVEKFYKRNWNEDSNEVEFLNQLYTFYENSENNSGYSMNYSKSMFNDQYGMPDIFLGIRNKKELSNYALGYDLSTADLHCRPGSPLYKTFSGPFTDASCRLQDVCAFLPFMRLKHLKSIDLKRHSDDTLFYLFYTCTKELMQIAAADELYMRRWRYNIKMKLWFIDVSNIQNFNISYTAKNLRYYIFNPISWKMLPLNNIDLSNVEGKPKYPPLERNVIFNNAVDGKITLKEIM